MEEITWFTLNEATFYAFLWAIGFAVGFMRLSADDAFVSWRISFFAGGLSGFLSAASCGIYINFVLSGGVVLPWGFVCVAALIGALAKHQIDAINAIGAALPNVLVERLKRKFGITKDGDKGDKT